MTTREKLDELFRNLRDQALEEFQNVQFAARRMGTDPVGELQADLEVGWACRLLQRFGTLRKLSLDTDCRGRAFLKQQGIPDENILNIATTYSQEFDACNSGLFRERLTELLEQHNITDTPYNREQVSSDIWRARADVLLDKERYREIPDVTVDEAFEWAQHDISDSDEARLQAGVEDKAGTPVEPHVSQDATPAVEVVIETKPVQQVPAAPVFVPSGVDLEVSKFLDTAEEMIAGQRQTWIPKTARDLMVVVRLLVGILDEHGVKTSSGVTQFHIGELRTFFDLIPRNYGQSSRLRSMPIAELREHCLRLKEEGVDVGLSANTIRKHLANLMRFIKYLTGRGFALVPLTVEGIRPGKPERGVDVRNLTEKPNADRLRPMFEMPVFRGCKNALSQEETGDQVFHSANYFVPMLLAYLGARRGEITGLALADIIETQLGWVVEIRPNKFRRIKKAQSVRTLPVPDEMIRLGFIEYVRALKERGHDALFPELHGPKGRDTGDRFYRDFIGLAKKHLGDDLWDRTLHALRHGHADTLKQANVDHQIINDISGRSGTDETSTRYTNAASLPLIKKALSHYPPITDGLTKQPLRLLPWVDERKPAPWVNRTREDRLEQANIARAKAVQRRQSKSKRPNSEKSADE